MRPLRSVWFQVGTPGQLPPHPHPELVPKTSLRGWGWGLLSGPTPRLCVLMAHVSGFDGSGGLRHVSVSYTAE